MPCFFCGAASSSHCSGVLIIACILVQSSGNVESTTIPKVKRPVTTQLVRFAACALVAALISFAYYRVIHVNPATVGFTFLLAILIVSAFWGLRHAIFLAILATLAYNYFFLPPVFHFTIADPQNWIALFSFLITAIIASQLSERARREAVQSNQ